jgi:hypothetical protein
LQICWVIIFALTLNSEIFNLHFSLPDAKPSTIFLSDTAFGTCLLMNMFLCIKYIYMLIPVFKTIFALWNRKQKQQFAKLQRTIFIMGILINNMKIIHTSTFTIIHTNFNHYLETTQRKQREIIIRRKEWSLWSELSDMLS